MAALDFRIQLTAETRVPVSFQALILMALC